MYPSNTPYNNNVYDPTYQIPHQKRIDWVDSLPVPYSNRRITDICCCCLGVLFGLVLFILACVFFNRANLLRANFPTDIDGNVCMLDKGANGNQYPLLYFSDLSNPMASRRCVQDCPQPGMPTQCFNGPCNLGYYPNYPNVDRLGAYCMPQDQAAQQKLQAQAGIGHEKQLIRSIDYVLFGLLIAAIIGLIWMLLMCCCAKFLVWIAFILAIILLIITGILFLIDHKTVLSHSKGWAIFFAVVCFIMALLLVFYLVVHRRRVKLCGIFLHEANKMLRKTCFKSYFWIPIFILLAFLFGILIVFQYLAFSSMFSPTFSENSLFSDAKRSWILIVLLGIQMIWGYSFLRDAFYFIISANAVDYYFQKEVGCCSAFKALICKHFGSVAGGSFLSGFLYFPSLIVDICCNSQDCLCCGFPRMDVYPYIYMTSTSYCPSARQVQYLCRRSRICRGNQSTNMLYSLAVRIVMALIPMLLIYWISRDNSYSHTVNGWVLLGVFLISLFITCFFVDIHVAAAQGLLVSFLAEYEVGQYGYKGMEICRQKLKNAIDKAERVDGHYKQKW